MIIENLTTIGICGRSGAGKGYVCSRFLGYGIPSIDTDMVYRNITSGSLSYECLKELEGEFGKIIIDKSGALNRRELSKIVFAQGCGEKLKRLNEITHKYIFAETVKIANEYKNTGVKAIIIDAPVLFESGFDYYCDIKICVTASDELSVSRIVMRDMIYDFEAKQRLANQMSNEELLKRCDFEIKNDNESDVDLQVRQIITRIEEMQYEI